MVTPGNKSILIPIPIPNASEGLEPHEKIIKKTEPYQNICYRQLLHNLNNQTQRFLCQGRRKDIINYVLISLGTIIQMKESFRSDYI